MSAFKVKRTYRQLIAERNALAYYIKQREKARCKCQLSTKQLSELESDKALLAKIENDIEHVREVIDEDLPTRLEGSD